MQLLSLHFKRQRVNAGVIQPAGVACFVKVPSGRSSGILKGPTWPRYASTAEHEDISRAAGASFCPRDRGNPTSWKDVTESCFEAWTEVQRNVRQARHVDWICILGASPSTLCFTTTIKSSSNKSTSWEKKCKCRDMSICMLIEQGKFPLKMTVEPLAVWHVRQAHSFSHALESQRSSPYLQYIGSARLLRMLGSLQAQAGASAASQLSAHRHHRPQCRPVAPLCRACSSFGAGQLGQQGIPPRLTSFVQRSIIRTESYGGAAPVEEQPSKVGPLPAAFTEKYLLRKLLGKGSFGTVRSAVDKETGLERAAKILPKDRAGKDKERVLAHLREEASSCRCPLSTLSQKLLLVAEVVCIQSGVELIPCCRWRSSENFRVYPKSCSCTKYLR